MEQNIFCGDCDKFGKKRIVTSRTKNPFRLGRLRGRKHDYCLHYDLPAKETDFYGLCEVAKRIPVKIEFPSLVTADPETVPPKLHSNTPDTP
jgi:hypothetical protein|tara:strand:- start:825 stop:1100 length:276 start_codon:yes stop_codon:yes gene_type:complete